jgi:hypothetical protein
MFAELKEVSPQVLFARAFKKTIKSHGFSKGNYGGKSG